MLRLALSCLACISAPVAAQESCSSEVTLITEVRLFDGDDVYEDRSVLLRDCRVASTDYRGDPPEEARIIDGTGRTLLPGLIDAHVHHSDGIKDALLFGVTTVIDQFSDLQRTERIRRLTELGNNPKWPDIVSAGTAATAQGGHGTQFGRSISTISGPNEAEDWVDDRISEGSQFIKIVREPGFSSSRPLPTLDFATIRALVTAAHERGVIAVCHANKLEDARICLDAGVNGLVHGVEDALLDDEFLSAAQKAGIFVSPTFAVAESAAGRTGSAMLIGEINTENTLSSGALSNLQTALGGGGIEALEAIMRANISALHRAGVPILAGTDAPNRGTWFGISLHREILLLVESGLSPKAALIAATSAPADAYGLDGHGRIANGAAADLVLVDGNPTEDIAAIHAIVGVWKDGQQVTRLSQNEKHDDGDLTRRVPGDGTD